MFWKASGWSGNLPDGLESFQMVWKVFRWSEQFSGGLDSFQMVCKLSMFIKTFQVYKKFPGSIATLLPWFFRLCKKISQGETRLLTQFLSTPIHKDKSLREFGQMVKYICLNCQMFLSNLQNSNKISFFSHSHSQGQTCKNIILCSVTRSVIVSPS